MKYVKTALLGHFGTCSWTASAMTQAPLIDSRHTVDWVSDPHTGDDLKKGTFFAHFGLDAVQKFVTKWMRHYRDLWCERWTKQRKRWLKKMCTPIGMSSKKGSKIGGLLSGSCVQICRSAKIIADGEMPDLQNSGRSGKFGILAFPGPEISEILRILDPGYELRIL
jgi:hypothetical protein